jgi:PAS domain S-box-containing protein
MQPKDSDRENATNRRSESLYQRLLRGIPQGVYILDANGVFVEVNEGTERILQRTAAELVGTSFRSVMVPTGARPVGDVFRRVITGAEEDVLFEACVLRPSGEERTLEVTASAIRGDDGVISGLYGIARDVTDENAMLLALSESEERLREIATNVRELFWIYTPDFSQALYMSPAFERMFDQPVDDVYRDGRAFLARVHPDDLQQLLDAMERVRRESVIGVEYRIVNDDGSHSWILARGYPVRDASGTVVRIVGTAENINERKHAELALRDSERQLRQILDALPVGAVLAEQPGRLVWNNAAADRIWGGVRPAGPEAYEHYHAWWTDSGLPIEPVEWPLARALMHGEEVHGELIDIETFDGARRTTLMSAVPLRNAAGEVTSAIQVQEDVTEARARDAEQRLLAAALEGLSEGIWLVTPDGEIVYANETFTRMVGVDHARVPGLRFDDFADPGNVRELRDNLAYALEHGRWSGRVLHRRTNDGVELPIDVVLGRVEHEGAARLLFGIAQDASVEVERERHLRRAERLASVGTMIGGVAHELNNPLQAILNFAQLLMLDERSAEDREALTAMEREAQRMAKIVADLKQIARSTQDEPGRTSSADLNDVVRHVMKVQEYLMRTSNIEVRLDLGADLPPILVDRGQLEQVVLNLVVNAEQAMSAHAGGGRLILRTRASALGASLHVVDNGHGIPPHQLERIFDPFFTTKAPGVGTGLGLSLVHSIVTENGGEIRVDSEIGTGTAFRLEWQRASSESAVAAPARDEPARRTGMRILIVDDETALRTVMARYLSRRGHIVEQAADGAAALEMLEHAQYDVILSDLRMPGLGGEALMERLRDRGLADSVIFMTGDAAGAAARLADAGVPVLLKPVELAEVARALEDRVT